MNYGFHKKLSNNVINFSLIEQKLLPNVLPKKYNYREKKYKYFKHFYSCATLKIVVLPNLISRACSSVG